MTVRKDMTPGDAPAELLDHARDFVNIVRTSAPGLYAEWLELPRFQALIDGKTAFNHGKLYAWAEYVVFRKEFLRRFPEATRAACVNAFSGLFLKNDISITNLLILMEPGPAEELQRLKGETR
jgi:hypothetical protein